MERLIATGVVVLLCLSGVDSQLSSMTSCVGDEVTYNCTVESVAHRWDFGVLTATVLIGDGLNDPQQEGPYTLERVAANSNLTVVSTLSVTAFADLDGTLISCRDGIAAENVAETQTTTANVFGLPSSPTLVVTAVNLTTLNFTISPPDRAGQCVLDYTITSTDSDGTMQNITVEVDDTEHLETQFILCNNTYSFTIVANTLSGPGQRSEVVNPNKVDFLTPQLRVANSDFSVTIMGTVPTDFPTLMDGVSVSLRRSSPGTVDCETNVAIDPTNNDVSVTVMDQLTCRYAGQTVTYCLQFTTDQCDSDTVMESTDQLPQLISSLTEGVSSTPGTVTLMVDVNDQHNCVGQNTLTITATVTDGATDISTQVGAVFTDGPITLGSVPIGEFTCIVTVVDAMGPIESQEISCENSPISAPSPIGGIVGGVVGGVAGVSVVAIVVVVILIVMKKKGKGDPEKNVTATEMKPTGTYQPEADDHPDSSGPTATYADPRSIEHEAVGSTGDEYALVTKPSKKKNTNTDMTGDAGAVGDMYSVPDKSKKQKNAGLVYADLEVTNQSRRAAPVAPRGIGSAYPAANDNEPVMYSTVQ